MTHEYQKLQEKIKQVRQRFRWIVLARGLVFSLTGSLVIVAVAILLVEHWNYSNRAISLVRVFAVLVILGLFALFLALPVLRKELGVHIARYIEVHHPALQRRC